MTHFTPTPSTRIRQHADRGSYDRALAWQILDEALVAHVGFSSEGRPFVIPMAFARLGDSLILHGAPASRTVRTLAGGAPVCATVTLLDGLVLARSAMHHSMNYRSVVVVGVAREITDGQEKLQAFNALVDKVSPGRAALVRAASASEVRATRVVAVPIQEASVKVRAGGPLDSAEDLPFPVWAGVVPLRLTAGVPVMDAGVDPALPPPLAR